MKASRRRLIIPCISVILAGLMIVGARGFARAQNVAPPAQAPLAQGQNVEVPDAEAKPFLHPRFSENAVLQRDRAISMSGWTQPGTQEAKRRLALNALQNSYGKAIESSGPTLRSVKPVNGAIQLLFDHAQDLNLKGDRNRVFAIAGTDLKFAWATPLVAGNTITLKSPDVAAPLYARFGWLDNPRASLYNPAGLPASPFRTDEDPRFPVALAQNRADAAVDAWNAAFIVF